MFIHIVDDNGLFVTDDFIEELPIVTETVTDDEGNTVTQPKLDENGNTILDTHYITVDCPQGFILPRWTGTEWVEGGTAPIPVVTVEDLKLQLSETDYKIIKCTEYQLAGMDLPYDISALHTERQAIRDKINELEEA